MMSYAFRDLLRYQTEESMDKLEGRDPEKCLKDVKLWKKDSNSTCLNPILEAPGAMVGRNG